MNINNVYLAKIYIKRKETLNENGFYDHEGVFVKYALVYEKFDRIKPIYVDLETGKSYDKFRLWDAILGESYMYIEAGLIPYTSLVDTNKKNMSKRRILKKFNDSVKKCNNENNKGNNNDR